MHVSVQPGGSHTSRARQRSTHFGETSGGACGFGLYGLCANRNSTEGWVGETIGDTCDAFCLAYPSLCQDPTGTNLTMRGNFAAPNGDYYTQVRRPHVSSCSLFFGGPWGF